MFIFLREEVVPKWVLPGFAVLCATSLWLNTARVSATEQPAPTIQNVQQWNGKFVVLNFFGNRRFHVTVLRNAGIAKLGERSFVVGEYATNDVMEVDDEWEEVGFWIPVENVDNVMVVKDRASARRAVDLYQREHAGDTPTEADGESGHAEPSDAAGSL